VFPLPKVRKIPMIRLPNEITVGGHTVFIRYPYHFRERTDLFGQYDFGMKEIRITDIDAG
jgi:hypothetical protein